MKPQPAAANRGRQEDVQRRAAQELHLSRVAGRPDIVIPPRGRWRNNGLMAYVFDPDIVHECSLPSLGQPKPDMFDAFAAAMEAQVPRAGSTSTSRGSSATPAAR